MRVRNEAHSRSFRERVRNADSITPEDVDQYNDFRRALRDARPQDILDVARSYNLIIDDTVAPARTLRKVALIEYARLHFGLPERGRDRQEELQQTMEKIVDNFRLFDSKCVVWVAGSLGRGKVGTASDLDLAIGVPHIKQPEHRLKEVKNLLHSLSQADVTFSERDKPENSLDAIIAAGGGSIFLGGITQHGIQVDLEAISLVDLGNYHKVNMPPIRRYMADDPRHREYITFDGERASLFTKGDSDPNHIRMDGKVYKGLLPDRLTVSGKLMYDPDDQGAAIGRNLWVALVKAFIFHNAGYERSGPHQRVDRINKSAISFSKFLEQIYTSNPESYSPARLKELQDMYNYIVSGIVKKYDLTIVT